MNLKRGTVAGLAFLIATKGFLTAGVFLLFTAMDGPGSIEENAPSVATSEISIDSTELISAESKIDESAAL